MYDGILQGILTILCTDCNNIIVIIVSDIHEKNKYIFVRDNLGTSEMDILGNLIILILDFLVLRANSDALAAEGIEPNFDVTAQNVTVIAGQIALLPCSVNNLGEYQIVWEKELITLAYEDQIITDDSRISITRPYLRDWHLEIRDVEFQDQGTYRCTVNTEPVTTKVVRLHVKVPAKIIDELSGDDVTVREGDTVVLVCNVSGVPKPTVRWYRRPVNTFLSDDVESKNCKLETRGPGIGSVGEMVIIQNITRYCDDVYECVAENGVEEATSRQMRVTVEYPPEVSVTVDRLGQILGKETVLECTIYGFPLETAYWLKNGFVVDDHFSERHKLHLYQQGPSKVVLSLTIKDLHEQDFGRYTCFAKNYMGDSIAPMELYVDYPRYPDHPQKPPISVEEPGTDHTYHTEDVNTQIVKKHPTEPRNRESAVGGWSSTATTPRSDVVFSLLPLTSVILLTYYTRSHL